MSKIVLYSYTVSTQYTYMCCVCDSLIWSLQENNGCIINLMTKLAYLLVKQVTAIYKLNEARCLALMVASIKFQFLGQHFHF